MIVRIQDIKIGDYIKESRGSGFRVDKLDFLSCSSRGVHVNSKYCYEWDSEVSIVEKEPEYVDISDEEVEAVSQAEIEQYKKANKARHRRKARERAYA